MDKIVVAKTAGFCMGVKRAVDMVLELLDKSKGSVYTYGPLIHNPQVTELLAKKGITVFSDNRTPKEGAVVIRTHGIPPSIRKKLEKSGVNIFDATCPFVIKVQRIIEEYSRKGYFIIIVGDKGHAEVSSYLGYAKKGLVLSNADEINRLNIKGKICVVAQTTQDRRKFNEIVRRLKKININLKVFDTICNATSSRQEEALSLSRNVDAVIVIGGKNSANTKRLAEISRRAGAKTYFIERAGDINIRELSKFKKIGVTAGASTSKETIKDVVDIIKNEIAKGDGISKKGLARDNKDTAR